MSQFLKNLPVSFFRTVVSSRPIFNQSNSFFSSISQCGGKFLIPAPRLAISSVGANEKRSVSSILINPKEIGSPAITDWSVCTNRRLNTRNKCKRSKTKLSACAMRTFRTYPALRTKKKDDDGKCDKKKPSVNEIAGTWGGKAKCKKFPFKGCGQQQGDSKAVKCKEDKPKKIKGKSELDVKLFVPCEHEDIKPGIRTPDEIPQIDCQEKIKHFAPPIETNIKPCVDKSAKSEPSLCEIIKKKKEKKKSGTKINDEKKSYKDLCQKTQESPKDPCVTTLMKNRDYQTGQSDEVCRPEAKKCESEEDVVKPNAEKCPKVPPPPCQSSEVKAECKGEQKPKDSSEKKEAKGEGIGQSPFQECFEMCKKVKKKDKEKTKPKGTKSKKPAGHQTTSKVKKCNKATKKADSQKKPSKDGTKNKCDLKRHKNDSSSKLACDKKPCIIAIIPECAGQPTLKRKVSKQGSGTSNTSCGSKGAADKEKQPCQKSSSKDLGKPCKKACTSKKKKSDPKIHKTGSKTKKKGPPVAKSSSSKGKTCKPCSKKKKDQADERSSGKQTALTVGPHQSSPSRPSGKTVDRSKSMVVSPSLTGTSLPKVPEQPTDFVGGAKAFLSSICAAFQKPSAKVAKSDSAIIAKKRTSSRDTLEGMLKKEKKSTLKAQIKASKSNDLHTSKSGDCQKKVEKKSSQGECQIKAVEKKPSKEDCQKKAVEKIASKGDCGKKTAEKSSLKGVCQNLEKKSSKSACQSKKSAEDKPAKIDCKKNWAEKTPSKQDCQKKSAEKKPSQSARQAKSVEKTPSKGTCQKKTPERSSSKNCLELQPKVEESKPEEKSPSKPKQCETKPENECKDPEKNKEASKPVCKSNSEKKLQEKPSKSLEGGKQVQGKRSKSEDICKANWKKPSTRESSKDKKDQSCKPCSSTKKTPSKGKVAAKYKFDKQVKATKSKTKEVCQKLLGKDVSKSQPSAAISSDWKKKYKKEKPLEKKDPCKDKAQGVRKEKKEEKKEEIKQFVPCKSETIQPGIRSSNFEDSAMCDQTPMMQCIRECKKIIEHARSKSKDMLKQVKSIAEDKCRKDSKDSKEEIKQFVPCKHEEIKSALRGNTSQKDEKEVIKQFVPCRHEKIRPPIVQSSVDQSAKDCKEQKPSAKPPKCGSKVDLDKCKSAKKKESKGSMQQEEIKQFVPCRNEKIRPPIVESSVDQSAKDCKEQKSSAKPPKCGSKVDLDKCKSVKKKDSKGSMQQLFEKTKSQTDLVNYCKSAKRAEEESSAKDYSKSKGGESSTDQSPMKHCITECKSSAKSQTKRAKEESSVEEYSVEDCSKSNGRESSTGQSPMMHCITECKSSAKSKTKRAKEESSVEETSVEDCSQSKGGESSTDQSPMKHCITECKSSAKSQTKRAKEESSVEEYSVEDCSKSKGGESSTDKSPIEQCLQECKSTVKSQGSKEQKPQAKKSAADFCSRSRPKSKTKVDACRSAKKGEPCTKLCARSKPKKSKSKTNVRAKSKSKSDTQVTKEVCPKPEAKDEECLESQKTTLKSDCEKAKEAKANEPKMKEIKTFVACSFEEIKEGTKPTSDNSVGSEDQTPDQSPLNQCIRYCKMLKESKLKDGVSAKGDGKRKEQKPCAKTCGSKTKVAEKDSCLKAAPPVDKPVPRGKPKEENKSCKGKDSKTIQKQGSCPKFKHSCEELACKTKSELKNKKSNKKASKKKSTCGKLGSAKKGAQKSKSSCLKSDEGKEDGGFVPCRHEEIKSAVRHLENKSQKDGGGGGGNTQLKQDQTPMNLCIQECRAKKAKGEAKGDLNQSPFTLARCEAKMKKSTKTSEDRGGQKKPC